MKYKRFEDIKPSIDGEYWYLGRKNHTQAKVVLWDNKQKEFKGDLDQHGYHSYSDPEYWCEIEYPKHPYTREESIENAAKKVVELFDNEAYTLECFDSCMKELRDAIK